MEGSSPTTIFGSKVLWLRGHREDIMCYDSMETWINSHCHFCFLFLKSPIVGIYIFMYYYPMYESRFLSNKIVHLNFLDHFCFFCLIAKFRLFFILKHWSNKKLWNHKLLWCLKCLRKIVSLQQYIRFTKHKTSWQSSWSEKSKICYSSREKNQHETRQTVKKN